jgi:hypothetical protein
VETLNLQRVLRIKDKKDSARVLPICRLVETLKLQRVLRIQDQKDSAHVLPICHLVETLNLQQVLRIQDKKRFIVRSANLSPLGNPEFTASVADSR